MTFLSDFLIVRIFGCAYGAYAHPKPVWGLDPDNSCLFLSQIPLVTILASWMDIDLNEQGQNRFKGRETFMNILFYGPNGSGKGTQGAVLKDKYQTPHIESGAIFRENISGKTELGKQAKAYIDRGNLVPDDIAIPMMLARLKKDDCKNGWLLDGFPRNKNQAVKLNEALKEAGITLDVIVEIILDREIAKNRIMGRRLCMNDNNHPNNIFIDVIKPDGDKCRVCGGELTRRDDDQDEDAICKRLGIYYDSKVGTLAAAYYFKDIAEKGTAVNYITLDGKPSLKEVTAELISKL